MSDPIDIREKAMEYAIRLGGDGLTVVANARLFEAWLRESSEEPMQVRQKNLRISSAQWQAAQKALDEGASYRQAAKAAGFRYPSVIGSGLKRGKLRHGTRQMSNTERALVEKMHVSLRAKAALENAGG